MAKKKQVELSVAEQAIADMVIARDTLIEELKDQLVLGNLVVSDIGGFYELGAGTNSDVMEAVCIAAMEETGIEYAISRILSPGNTERHQLSSVGDAGDKKEVVETTDGSGFTYVQFADLADAETVVEALKEVFEDEDEEIVGMSDADESIIYIADDSFAAARKVMNKMLKAEEIAEYTVTEIEEEAEDDEEEEEEEAPKSKKASKKKAEDDDWGDEPEEDVKPAKGKTVAKAVSAVKGKAKAAPAAKGKGKAAPAAKGKAVAKAVSAVKGKAKAVEAEEDEAVNEFDKLIKFLTPMDSVAGKKRAREILLKSVVANGFVKSRKARIKDLEQVWELTEFKGKQEDKAMVIWEALEAAM